MYNSGQNETEILKFWDENKTFEKSVTERPAEKPYVFYDGPPFATGLPHYGHIVASLMKDAMPRYWTMRGWRVERKWGWDCHGLPIENIIEKELRLNSKKEVEKYGVAKFNEACRATVLKYAEEWKKTVNRMGRWVDMENDYKTMDLSYMESVWWVFKSLWDRGLIYKGHKAMHICPRCVTPLSNFEVTQGYKDVKDISVTIKFKVVNAKEKIGLDGNVFILAWTTTPWTLPGNVLLTVNKSIEYLVLSIEGENGFYVIAKGRVKAILKDRNYKIKREFLGEDLLELQYEPLFPYFANTPRAFRVVEGDFVTTSDGTGIVHIAPAFGEDDYQIGKREGVPMVQHVAMDGRFIEEVEDFAGYEVKPAAEPTATDVEILKWLSKNDKLFSKEGFTHSYPHCWRCDTPLLNFAASSWFVEVTKLKEQLLKNNKNINWVPKHIKDGRFGEWLANARDWAISRNRFWGTPLPVWECSDAKCGHSMALGSVAELEKLSGKKIIDIHKHIIDGINFPCEKCGGNMKRVPEVLDCWFESGSMPYGQTHYPFENKAEFEAGFPAEFIAEGQDQTRGWFYTLHVIAAALTAGDQPAIPTKKSLPAFKNVIVNGIVLAEDGKKMAKRLKNYPEPGTVIDKYGADALRYYLITSPVMEAENLNFSETGVREVYNKLINTLWNVMEFYKMYAACHPRVNGDPDNQQLDSSFRGNDSKNILDKWILSKLQQLVKDVSKGMESYQLIAASRPIMEFVTELSQWYLRRSRERFKGDNEADRQAGLTTLREVLLTLSKIMAPFTPFIAEKIYQELKNNDNSLAESVHLDKWPVAQEKLIDQKIIKQMSLARKVVEMGLALRAEKGMKVRQPLAQLSVAGAELSKEILTIIAEELNVKEAAAVQKMPADLATKEDGALRVWLDTTLTEELKADGLQREIVRAINQLRKEMKLTIQDRVVITYETTDNLIQQMIVKRGAEIAKQVLALELIAGAVGADGQELKLEDYKVRVKIKKM